LFSFLPPQTEVATHDPGFSAPATLLKRDAPDLYHYNIDTRGMRGGVGWWYFYSEDDDVTKRRAKVGKFVVTDAPRSLIDRTFEHDVIGAGSLTWWQRLKSRHLLGIDVFCGSR